MAVRLYARGDGGWDVVDADRLAEVIDLSKLSCSLALADIYEGTELEETPPGSEEQLPG